MITTRSRKLIVYLLRNQRDYFADRAAALNREAVIGATDQNPKVQEYHKKARYYSEAVAEVEALPITIPTPSPLP